MSVVERFYELFPELRDFVEKKLREDEKFRDIVSKLDNPYELLLLILPEEERRHWVRKVIELVGDELVRLVEATRPIRDIISGNVGVKGIIELLRNRELIDNAIAALNEFLEFVAENREAILTAFLYSVKREYRDAYTKLMRRLVEAATTG